MQIILTHEMADFDALASLLGAYLLDDGSLPILPRRLNRNVRAFQTLYGMELPFVDPRDMPHEPIESVTLVDTQSLVTLRGMSSKTSVRVLDHHPVRDNLPPEWTVIYQDVGATSTLLVDYLRERDIPLTNVQATLLLLGIYEDTGSLTYGSTAPSDLHAAAYLLEQGANLEVAASFLNHPLSLEQQQLYDQLRNQSRSLEIHGHTIILAWADAGTVDEELSTIAHKLRDLLDPDALFVLVKTRAGVQIIARSTSEHIDVAAVLSGLGGGGHERAAACLVRNRSIEQVQDELEQRLPEFVRPAITVAEIMSSGVNVLAPETPIREAALRMQRYGYEGYPVVKDGRVVGLLNRRDVDRALAHEMFSASTETVMDGGAHTIHPGDSIQQLMRLMTDSGWGQIPVADPGSGAIIGIVTRTDLLKTLAPEPRLPGRMNLAPRLESALLPETLALLRIIAQAASEQHVALYIVGGFVRDLLLERPSQDFDLVVEGDAISLARHLAERYGGKVTSHSRFSTAKWYLPEPNPEAPLPPVPGLVFIDLVSARTEFYTHPTALPTVERGSIKLDLHRRDFTINTLALRLDGHHYGQMHDYWGGYNDLRLGLVRVLHSISFIDDPTRLLRAARFEQRFRFRIEERTLQLLREALPLLERVSGERIRHELNHILVDSETSWIMRRLNELKLLAAIHPALTWDAWLDERFANLSQVLPTAEWGVTGYHSQGEFRRDLGYILWLMRLPGEAASQVCERLVTSVELRHAILDAGELWRDLPDLQGVPASKVVSRLEDVKPLARYAAFLAAADDRLQAPLKQYTLEWQHIQSTFDGHDLRRMGLPPGPVYSEILSILRAAWLDGQVTTPQDEQALLAELLADPDIRNKLADSPSRSSASHPSI